MQSVCEREGGREGGGGVGGVRCGLWRGLKDPISTLVSEQIFVAS